MDPATEIRKLKPAELCTLTRILAASDSWKILMAVVPKEGSENVGKFNSEHFAQVLSPSPRLLNINIKIRQLFVTYKIILRIIEGASCQQRRSAAEIFLEEWSTMGKKRPTLQSTLNLLVKAQLFRAADYIAVDLLRGQRPVRPKCGPAAEVEISDEAIAELLENALQASDKEFAEIESHVETERTNSTRDVEDLMRFSSATIHSTRKISAENCPLTDCDTAGSGSPAMFCSQLDSSELPEVVVEIARRISNQPKTSEPIISHQSTTSVESSDYSATVSNSSSNSTESGV